MVGVGPRIYGLGAITVGAVSLAFPEFGLGQPLPPHVPAHEALAYGGAAILILGGIALNLPRTAAAGAAVLAALYALWAAALNGPSLVAHPLAFGGWENIAVMVAQACGGVVAYALLRGGEADRSAVIARVGRVMFGLCLLIFGGAHFVYAKFTASLVPAWLPPGQMFWTYATGVAAIAAGLAILSGIQARLAALLLTVMYVIFQLAVHARVLLADPHAHANWSEFCVNLVLIGAAWTVWESLRGKAPE